jgi:hypothetical protein
MGKKPAWTEREAIVEAMNVDFSRSQVSNLRKALSGGDKKNAKAKTKTAARKSRATDPASRRTSGTRARAAGA